MAIELLLSDVDGVMTDGGLVYAHTMDGAHVESKTFNIQDGQGIRLWQKAGREFGIVTGRRSEIVARRAGELDIAILHQGVDPKLPVVEKIAAERNLSLDEIAYVGDDLPDLPVIRRVGFGVAVGDAAAEVKAGARHVLQTAGGRGAVRELIELLLREAGKWEAVLADFN